MDLGSWWSVALAAGLIGVGQPAAAVELSSATRRTLDVLADIPESALGRLFDGGGAPLARAVAVVAAPGRTLARPLLQLPAPLPELGARARGSLAVSRRVATVGSRAVGANLSTGLRTHAPKAIVNAAWSLFTVGVAAGLAAADWLYKPAASREPTNVEFHRGKEGRGQVLVRAGAGGLLDRLIQASGFTPSESVVVLKESDAAAMRPLEREGLLVHELVHTRQWRESYVADFLVEYFRLKRRFGYWENPKEREAFQEQQRFLCSRGNAAACRTVEDAGHSHPERAELRV